MALGGRPGLPPRTGLRALGRSKAAGSPAGRVPAPTSCLGARLCPTPWAWPTRGMCTCEFWECSICHHRHPCGALQGRGPGHGEPSTGSDWHGRGLGKAPGLLGRALICRRGGWQSGWAGCPGASRRASSDLICLRATCPCPRHESQLLALPPVRLPPVRQPPGSRASVPGLQFGDAALSGRLRGAGLGWGVLGAVTPLWGSGARVWGPSAQGSLQEPRRPPSLRGGLDPPCPPSP